MRLCCLSILFALSFISLCPARASPATPPMPDGGLEFVKSHKDTLKNSGQINDRLFQPAMSDGVEFETFDGKTRFAANITCASEAPIVRVTAFPVGSLSGIGELNIRIEYDRDLNGTLEGVTTVTNVGGMCGNGLITDCSPSGSWKNCRYCRWTTDGGGIRAQCDYGGDGATKAPIGPQGMRGCFCFNNSCGSPSPPDAESYLSTPLCSCQDGAFQRIGLVMGFREPAFMVDVVKDAWCFAGFGVDMGKSSVWGYGSADNGSDKFGQRQEYSAHTHSYFYNPLFLLELLMDARCLEKVPTGISDLSEVRPEHLDSQLNLMLYPQTLLFANPVAVAACMADVVASTAGFPLDAMFWCAGEWGPLYPLTGTSTAKGASHVRAAANVAAKSIARSHNNLLLWGTKGTAALCGVYPQPVWLKSQYKLQPVRPVRSRLCPPIGRTELVWGAGMNPPNPKQADNFAYLLWRWRDCCSF